MSASRGQLDISGLRPFLHLLLGAGLLLTAGCLHHNQAVLTPAPAPPLALPNAGPPAASVPLPPAAGQAPAIADSVVDAEFVRSHAPIWSEEGLASWYGPPYDQHPGANGRIYDENSLTAAHRTLPMNSLIEVTNLSTGQSAIMRITDRGPFVPDRTLDLSLASAKAIGVWRPGVARVRVEVYASPAPLDRGGRWCVQVGAFKDGAQATKLRDRLTRKYEGAKVIEFTGPTGHWVRIRPLNDDKNRAIEIARDLRPTEGEAYLVRLD